MTQRSITASRKFDPVWKLGLRDGSALMLVRVTRGVVGVEAGVLVVGVVGVLMMVEDVSEDDDAVMVVVAGLNLCLSSFSGEHVDDTVDDCSNGDGAEVVLEDVCGMGDCVVELDEALVRSVDAFVVFS